MARCYLELKSGKLLVIEDLGVRGSFRMVRARCECGAELVTRANSIVTKKTRSCGCSRLAYKAHSETSVKIAAGKTRKPEYRSWTGIRARCFNKNEPAYAKYGGRGITVCDRWANSFDAFYEDMGPKPSSRHSIDRIDNNGPYSKDNCRWADGFTQVGNRRITKLHSFQGRCVTLREVANQTGLGIRLLEQRIRSKGISVEQAVALGKSKTPFRTKRAA